MPDRYDKVLEGSLAESLGFEKLVALLHGFERGTWAFVEFDAAKRNVVLLGEFDTAIHVDEAISCDCPSRSLAWVNVF